MEALKSVRFTASETFRTRHRKNTFGEEEMEVWAFEQKNPMKILSKNFGFFENIPNENKFRLFTQSNIN